MFRNITINLSGPICKCNTQHLLWSIASFPDNKNGLAIICNECKIKLEIPYDSFVAHFNLKTPYPKGEFQKPLVDPKSKLKCLNGGKVLEFKENPENTKDEDESPK